MAQYQQFNFGGIQYYMMIDTPVLVHSRTNMTPMPILDYLMNDPDGLILRHAGSSGLCA